MYKAFPRLYCSGLGYKKNTNFTLAATFEGDMTGSGAESLEVCHGITERNQKVTNSNLASHFFRRDVNEKQALTLPPFHVASHGPLPAHDAIFIQFHFVLSSACTYVFTDKIEPSQSRKEEHVLL